MSELYKSSNVVVKNDRYHISFTECHADAMSLRGYEEHTQVQSDAKAVIEYTQNMIQDAKKDAVLILDEAKEQADQILANAVKQKNEQYSNGYEQGLLKAEQQYQQKIDDINKAYLDILQTKEDLLNLAEKEVIELALSISEKILHEKISLEQENIKIYFEKAIEDILRNGYDIVAARLNKHNIERFYPDWEVEKFMINIRHDARLADDVCIVETETGDIDISVFTQFEEISKKLINA